MEKLMEYVQIFVRQIKAATWYIFRYIAMGAALSIACLSFVTGEFPPPIAKYYGQIKNFRESMDVIKQMQGAGGNQAVKQEAMYELERVRQEVALNGQIPQNPMAKGEKKEEEKVTAEFQARLSSTETELMEIRKRVVQAEKQIVEQQKQIDELKAKPTAPVLAQAPAPVQPQPQVQQQQQQQPQAQMPTPAKVTTLPSSARVPAATPTPAPTATPVPPSKFGAIPTTLPPKAIPAAKPVVVATPSPTPTPGKAYYIEPRAAPNTRLPLPPTQQPMGQPTSSN